MSGPWDLSEDQVAEFRAAFQAAADAGMHKHRLLTPLPRRVRARLWWRHQVTSAGIWLLDRHHERATIALWRICGMWRG